ncbi:hypothetical protein C5L14_22885 [Labrys okinawensis]|uniref:Uncharacterized protein n=1 Tax=Labrys okinawensis TaxID=346911 RepID=A0A2S9Q7H5_9HYPH|nr:hypothetical protein [Labrys okinawensis]PRH85295.1 hypothetical protein C5L14_22885 [Labrys okinawensis]
MTTNASRLHLARSPHETVWRLADGLLRREYRLALGGFVILSLMVPTAMALAIDDRTLNGISVWIKPLKFQLSVGLYLLTLAWFVGALPVETRHGRAVRILVTLALATSAFEIGYITLQAARGLASHYNVADPFYRLMYTLMGIGAVTLAAASPALAVLLLRHRPQAWSTAFWLSVLLGLTLTFVLGAGSGGVLSAGNGHWIGGVRSDATGVPIFGWSRTGGDLRVAHFLGLHALQIMPVLGLIAERWAPGRAASFVVCAAALAYGVATLFVFVQALRGIPFIPA